MNRKEAIYRYCNSFIQDRLNRIHNGISSIQDSLSTETKSSAGDKHETGRAMLQLEREKLGEQLAEAEKMEQTLTQVNINMNFNSVQLGSLVKTSKANYFLAISAGEYKQDDLSVYCISIQTPIAKILLGKTKGEIAIFNGNEMEILSLV